MEEPQAINQAVNAVKVRTLVQGIRLREIEMVGAVRSFEIDAQVKK